MRFLRIAGFVLVALGIFALLGKLDFSSERSAIEIGEFRATIKEKRPVPQWAGVLAVVAGVVLVAAGGKGKRE